MPTDFDILKLTNLKLTIREALQQYGALIETLVIENDHIVEFKIRSKPGSLSDSLPRRYTCSDVERRIIESCAKYARGRTVGKGLSPLGGELAGERAALLDPQHDWDDGEDSENAAVDDPTAGIRAVGFAIHRTARGYETYLFKPGDNPRDIEGVRFGVSSTLEAARLALPDSVIKQSAIPIGPGELNSMVECYL